MVRDIPYITNIWVNFITTSRRDLTLIIVSKGNHPKMALRFRVVKIMKYSNLPSNMISHDIPYYHMISTWYPMRSVIPDQAGSDRRSSPSEAALHRRAATWEAAGALGKSHWVTGKTMGRFRKPGKMWETSRNHIMFKRCKPYTKRGPQDSVQFRWFMDVDGRYHYSSWGCCHGLPRNINAGPHPVGVSWFFVHICWLKPASNLHIPWQKPGFWPWPGRQLPSRWQPASWQMPGRMCCCWVKAGILETETLNSINDIMISTVIFNG